MRKKLAMYAIYATIAIGIGTWVACNSDIAASTVPEPAAAADELEVPASVVGPGRMNVLSSGAPVTPEVRHGDGHRVWIERATPGSVLQLCEGDSLPALALRRSDPLEELHVWLTISDPELEGNAAHGETKHPAEHTPVEEEFEFAAGDMRISLPAPGTIHECPDCSAVRDVVIGIDSVHGHDEGSEHTETYEIGPPLTFAVHQSTHAVCVVARTANPNGA